MAKQTIGIGSAANDGTGDTLRSAFDKVNDNFTELYDASSNSSTLNVLSYGADNTGATDSLAAFDAAIAAASAGDRIYIPTGTFSLSNTWTISKQVTVFGPGTITEASVLTPVIEVTADKVQLHDFTVSGIETTGNWNTSSATIHARCGIHINDGDDCLISRVRIVTKSTGIKLTAANRTTIRDVLWHGINLASQPASYTESAGLRTVSAIDVLVDGGSWTLGGRGMALEGVLTARVTIKSPTIYTCESDGIYIDDPSGVQIIGGWIQGVDGYGINIEDGDTLTVSNVYVRSNTSASMFLGTGTVSSLKLNQSDLASLTFSTGTYDDVDLSGSDISTLTTTSGGTLKGVKGTPKSLSTVTHGATAGAPALEFNVMAFGAAGDGATDDTTAIQAAIDAAELVGGTVVFPAGTYVSNTSLANDQPIRIMGYGATLTVSTDYATQTAMLRLNGAGTEMYGLAIDGNDQVMRGLSIDPPSGGRVKIRDVTITNITAPVGSANTATGIQLGDEFDYIEILNCRIDGVDGRNTGDDVARGINAVGAGSGGGSLLVQGCWIGNITVNNEGINDADGISINNTSATDPTMTVRVIGNQFYNCDKRAVKIFNPRAIIQGNSVYWGRSPLPTEPMYAVFSAYGADVTIDGNDFVSEGLGDNFAQRFVDMSAGVGSEGSRLVVTNNRFRNSIGTGAGTGTYASGDSRAVHIVGNTTNYSEDLIISGNQFYNLKFGVYMDANADKIRRMVVTGNSFNGLVSRGIQAFSGSDVYELIFSGNIIETDVGSSVGILDLSIINGATVIGNRITSGTPATVFVGAPAGTLVTYGNTINGDLTGPEAISADNGDAAATLDAHADAWTQRWDTTLTADRAVTLGTGWKGAKFRVVRTAGGAFSLNVGTGPLKALAADEWCEVTYDGSAWFLSAYGSL